MEHLKIALDWTANTNHTGFFVAKELGFYEELGIAIELLTPDQDNYVVTPAKKVELGEADFALCPFESVVSYRTKENAFDAVAIAAIFREDISAIVSLVGSGIERPSDLDGKKYASYKARYEDEIVRQMIKNDGGKGDFEIHYPEKLGIWNTLLNKQCDATWVFMNWEGIHAKSKGIDLKAFKMSDFGIPYGYSPVILASERAVDHNRIVYADFLKATKKGFLFAQENPEEAIKFLGPRVAATDQDIDLLESQKFTSPYYGNQSNWGSLEKANVQNYLDWLHVHELELQKLDFDTLVYSGLL